VDCDNSLKTKLCQKPDRQGGPVTFQILRAHLARSLPLPVLTRSLYDSTPILCTAGGVHRRSDISEIEC